MAESSPSPFSTPKRKRINVATEDAPSPLTSHFSFQVSDDALSDGGSSPRTKITHRFRGLALADGGGGVAADGRLDDTSDSDAPDWKRMEIDEDETKMRKRTKLSPIPNGSLETQNPALRGAEIPDTTDAPGSQPYLAADPTAREPRFVPIPIGHVALDHTVLISSPEGSPNTSLKHHSTVGDHLLEAPKPKSRRGAGTPPLVGISTEAGNAYQSGDTAQAEIFDPIRAALTWHEDEITVYDPEDEDDDGTGINGIGFKPTPAIAHARTMKRKQQLAEYKKREDREARARRSLRRRGSPERPFKLERKDSARKVHFREAESTTMITI